MKSTFAVLFLLLASAFAQKQPADQPGQPVQQEAAQAQVSIHKVEPTDMVLINRVSLQGFRAFGLPIHDIIVAAYCPQRTSRGFSDAISTMHIDDKALGDDRSSFNVEVTGDSWQAALQKALQEQLGITVRRTTRQTPAYVLRVPPGGAAGLLSPGENVPDMSLAPVVKEKPLPPDTLKDMPPELRAKLEKKPKSDRPSSWTNLVPAKGELDASQASMASLVSTLEQVLQRPVVDETGLSGNYDVKLVWGGKGPKELLRLLHDQLGLDVQERDEPMEWLVAEKVEPTEHVSK